MHVVNTTFSSQKREKFDFRKVDKKIRETIENKQKVLHASV